MATYKGPVHEAVRKMTGDKLSSSKRSSKATTNKKKAKAISDKARSIRSKSGTPASRKRGRIQEGTWSLMGRGVKSYEDAKSMAEYAEDRMGRSAPAIPEIDSAMRMITKKTKKSKRSKK